VKDAECQNPNAKSMSKTKAGAAKTYLDFELLICCGI